jgi:glucose-6-phosphate 1-dehydrogenase
MEHLAESSINSKYLRTCDIPAAEDRELEAFTMVIFGGAGDLTRKKLMPAIFHLFSDKEIPEGFSVINFSRAELSDEQYRNTMIEEIERYGGSLFNSTAWDNFSRHLFSLSGRFEEDKGYLDLVEKLRRMETADRAGNKTVLYYMAVPPASTPVIVSKLLQHNLAKGLYRTRIIIEKPFGRDRATAKKLNRVLHDAFDEEQIYRIDHYLGKETVQNIIFMRFSNTIFEQLWNSHFVDNVQITVAEDIGIEKRGNFYEQSGVVRDIVQNHVMQLVGLIAMEPPIGFEADAIRDEKVKVFRSIRPLGETSIDTFAVRGQYGRGKVNGVDVPGYREEENVAGDSGAPTFIAAKFQIANWRWAGVPFYIRAGKRLPRRVTEICLQFRQPSLKLFGRTCDVLDPNVLKLTIQPEEKIISSFGVKYPYTANEVYPAEMAFSYQRTFNVAAHSPYERLLIDCMKGDLTLFVRQDGVEAMWDVVDPLIARWESNAPHDFPNYSSGTWGPREADLLLERDGRNWITK